MPVKGLLLQFLDMPKRTIRLLIALIVAIVVPLQGLAAAKGDLCMGVGPHHSHDAGAGENHQQDGHDDDGQGSAHCPPCVACCAAAAASASSAVLTADDGADRSIASSPLPISGIQPDTLDRPPLAL